MASSTTATIDKSELSPEVQHLSGLSLQRYVDKLNHLGIRDPYLMPESMLVNLKEYEQNNVKPDEIPDLSHQDIFYYLLDQYVLRKCNIFIKETSYSTP